MDLKTVYNSVSIEEINYVKTMLEANGIRAFIFDETIGGLAPHYVFGQGGSRLAVAESDVPTAQEMIAEYEREKKQNK